MGTACKRCSIVKKGTHEWYSIEFRISVQTIESNPSIVLCILNPKPGDKITVCNLDRELLLSETYGGSNIQNRRIREEIDLGDKNPSH